MVRIVYGPNRDKIGTILEEEKQGTCIWLRIVLENGFVDVWELNEVKIL